MLPTNDRPSGPGIVDAEPEARRRAGLSRRADELAVVLDALRAEERAGRRGRPPRHGEPLTIGLHLRLSPSLHARLVAASLRARRSPQEVLRHALEQVLGLRGQFENGEEV